MGCRFLVRHFFLWRVPDYLMIIIMAIIAAVVGAKVRPHCRSFEWSDPSINHPFTTKETFPMYSVVIAVIFIAVVYFAGELGTKWNRPAGKLNMCLHVNGWVVTHAYSILLAFVFVNVSKLYAGRLRPDFIARLAQEGITEANVTSYTHDQICHAARNGRLSFPSGHSGTAFAGYVPPCLYLMGLMRALKGGRVWLATIAMLPLILPVAIAVSRTVDYRHNFDDILCGSICGALCGVFAVLISFRVSMRGEWTLHDHPDDKTKTRAWLQSMLVDEEGRAMVLRVADSDSSGSDNESRESGEEDREREAAVPHTNGNGKASGHSQKMHHHPKHHPSADSKKSAGSARSSPLSADSLHDADYISPAVYQERAVNPSPSTRHRDTASPAGQPTRPQRETREDDGETSSGRRKSTGDPATVERFYPEE